MFDFERERVIPLREAPKYFPGNPHLSSVHRWSSHGVRGIFFESFKSGGRRYTTIEAIIRFINRLNGPSPGGSEPESRADKRHTDVATSRAEAIYGAR